MTNVRPFPSKGNDRQAVTDIIHDGDVQSMAIAVKYRDGTVETIWIDTTKADLAYFIQAFQYDLHNWMSETGDDE